MAGTDTNKVTINVNGTDLEFTKIGNILGPAGKDGIDGKSIYAKTVDPWSVSGWNPAVAGDLFLNTTTGILWSAKAGAVTSNVQSNWTKVGELARKITVDSSLSSTSTNPVQNKVIKSALDGKAGSSHSHSSLTNSSGRVFNVPTGGSGGEQKTLVITDDLNNYAASNHNHDNAYQKKGNYVTTDTAQTITGDKTFNTIRTNSNIIVDDTNNDTHTYYQDKKILYISYDSDGNIVEDYTYTLPNKTGTFATTDDIPKTGYTTNGKNYKVTTDNSGNLYVSVPWNNDTWRPVVDNLTTTDATKSLSANQGKVLKDLVDGKAASSHAHSSIRDIGNDATTTFAYSKAGLNYDDYTWLAGWNNYELRAVNKSQFAKASHTHTKSEVGLGNVDNTADANKSVNYANSAGSVAWGNVTGKPSEYTPSSHEHGYLFSVASINGNDTARYPWRRMMSIPATTQNYYDAMGTYYLSGNYHGAPYYLFRVEFRTNNSSAGNIGNFRISVIATNSDPNNLAIASYSVATNGVTTNYSDIFVKTDYGWPRMTLTRLSHRDYGSISYYNSDEGYGASSRIAAYIGINGSGTGYASYELHSLAAYTYVNYGTLTASVSYANSAGSARASNISMSFSNGVLTITYNS